jgi:hypothetical protein
VRRKGSRHTIVMVAGRKERGEVRLCPNVFVYGECLLSQTSVSDSKSLLSPAALPVLRTVRCDRHHCLRDGGSHVVSFGFKKV